MTQFVCEIDASSYIDFGCYSGFYNCQFSEFKIINTVNPETSIALSLSFYKNPVYTELLTSVTPLQIDTKKFFNNEESIDNRLTSFPIILYTCRKGEDAYNGQLRIQIFGKYISPFDDGDNIENLRQSISRDNHVCLRKFDIINED